MEEYWLYSFSPEEYTATTCTIVLLCDKKNHEWPTNFHSFAKLMEVAVQIVRVTVTSKPECELFGILKEFFQTWKRKILMEMDKSQHIHWFQLDILNSQLKEPLNMMENIIIQKNT